MGTFHLSYCVLGAQLHSQWPQAGSCARTSAFRQVRVLSASCAGLRALVLCAGKWYRGRDRQAQLVRAGWLLSVPVCSAEL